MDASLRELQDNEVEAIKAIFADEFAPIQPQPNVWKVSQPASSLPYFSLTLAPVTDDDALKELVSVKLEVRFTRNYPKDVPELAVTAPRGVAAEKLPQLLQNLRAKARELRGQEMVYELATEAQEWLAEHHSVSVRIPALARNTAPVISSYERMQSRHAEESQQRAREMRERAQELRRQRELEALAESQQLQLHMERETQRKEEARRRRIQERQRDGIDGLPAPLWFQLEGVFEIGTRFQLSRVVPLSPDDPDSPVLNSMMVLRRMTPPEHSKGDASAASAGAAESAGDKECTRVLCVDSRTETLILAHVVRTSHVHASTLIQGLKPLALSSSVATIHPHICTMYDFLLHHEDGVWSIMALEEACTEGTLERLIGQSKRLESRVACEFTFQILDALAHLHQYTPHGCLDLAHVLFSSEGTLKLSCANAVMQRAAPNWPEAWASKVEDTRGRDVYNVALIFLSMIAGSKVLEWYTPSTMLDLWSDSASASAAARFGRAGGFYSSGEVSTLEYKEARELLVRLPKSLKDTLSSILTHCNRSVSQLSHYFGAISRRIQALNLQGAASKLDSAADPMSASLAALATSPIVGGPNPLLSYANAPLMGGASALPVQSRYKADFEELEYIGRGGFGQVVKARNKLDGRMYAIKTVRLSRDSNDNRKLLREVRTLSRLNSVRCVRYFQAWIEDSQGTWIDDSAEDDDSYLSESESEASDDDNTPSPCGTPGLSAKFSDEEGDWISFERSASFLRSRKNSSATSESATYSFHKKYRSRLPPPTRSSEVSNGEEDHDHPSNESLSSLKILYIQMEYCENRTLSDVIEQGVTANEAWRMFRQIVEGLVHIHSQGMIHRDLKPKNVFMDASNNVKIGDFGLATTFYSTATHSMESADGGLGGAVTVPISIPGTGAAGPRIEDFQRSLTSDIGTALYTAPEILSRQLKYNQKVDQYSVGIILFELFHAFGTGMERVMTLRDLRQPEIKFPADFPDSPQKKIIEWLLQHDPAARPTSLELLQSHLLPTTMEEEYIQEAMRTVTNPANTAHFTKLMHTLFAQPPDQFREFTYDEAQPPNAKYAESQTVVQELLVRLFRLHGAQQFHPPLLAPAGTIYEGKRVAQLLDEFGTRVVLPYDQTVPFARHVARNNITECKRFTIAPVFRENGLGGQPRAALEADFDLVTPRPEPAAGAGGELGGAADPDDAEMPLAIEAEVMQVAAQVLELVPSVAPQSYHFVVNHGRLVDALYEHARVPAHQRQVVSATLEQMYKATALQVRAKLSLLLSKRCVDELLPFIGVHEFAAAATALSKVRAAATLPATAKAVTSALEHLERVIAWLRDLGVSTPVMLAPLLTNNASYYRDHMMFQVRLNAPHHRADVVASGGRYDRLLARFVHPSRRANMQAHGGSGSGSSSIAGGSGVGSQEEVGLQRLPAIAGVHFAVEKLTWLHHQQARASACTQVQIAAFGTAAAPGHLLAERMKLARDLWAAGVSAEFLYESGGGAASADVVVQRCRQAGIAFAVFLKSDASATVKVRNVRAKTEVDLPRAAVVDHIRGHLVAAQDAAGGAGLLDATLMGLAAAPLLLPAGLPALLPGAHGAAPAGLLLGGAQGHHGAGAGAASPTSAPPQVSFIAPPAAMKKLKNKQRQMVLEKAVANVHRNASELIASPIMAVYALPFPVLRAIAAEYARAAAIEANDAGNAAVKDGCGSNSCFKPATELVHTSADRDLVRQVHNALQKLKSAGHKTCFLYSAFHDAHCLAILA